MAWILSTYVCSNKLIFSSWLTHLVSHIDMPSLRLTLVALPPNNRKCMIIFMLTSPGEQQAFPFLAFHSDTHWPSTGILSITRDGQSLGDSVELFTLWRSPQKYLLATTPPPQILLLEWDQLEFWKEAVWCGLMEALYFNCWPYSCYFLAVGHGVCHLTLQAFRFLLIR